jgi:hypothetical protein
MTAALATVFAFALTIALCNLTCRAAGVARD